MNSITSMVFGQEVMELYEVSIPNSKNIANTETNSNGLASMASKSTIAIQRAANNVRIASPLLFVLVMVYLSW